MRGCALLGLWLIIAFPGGGTAETPTPVTVSNLEVASLPPEAQKKLDQAEAALEGYDELLAQDELDAVIEIAQRVLDLQLEALPGNHPIVIRSKARLGIAMGRFQQFDPGIGILEDALPLHRAAFGDDHPDTFELELLIADGYRHTGQIPQAGEFLRNVVTRLRDSGKTQTREFARARHRQGILAFVQGNTELMESAGREAVAVYRELDGERSVDAARARRLIALAYQARGDCLQSEKIYREVVEVIAAADQRQNLDYVAALNSLAGARMCLGDCFGAVETMTEAVDILGGLYGNEAGRTVAIKLNLASLLHMTGNPELSETYHQEVISVLAKTMGTDNPTYAQAMNNYGAQLLGDGRYEEAMGFLEEAYELRQKYLGPDHPRTIQTGANLGSALTQGGDRERGASLLWDSVTQLVEIYGAKHPKLVRGYRALAQTLPPGDGPSEALNYAMLALEITQMSAKLSFQTLREERKALWLESQAKNYDLPLSLLAAGQVGTDEQLRKLWEYQMFRKNLTLRLLAGQRGAIEALGDPALLERYETMLRDKEKYARFVYQAPRGLSEEELAAEIAALETRIAEAEEAISRKSVAFAVQQDALTATLREVLATLPKGAVLVDYYRYRNRLPESSSEFRYGAFVAIGNVVRFVDLGPASSIESGLAIVRKALHPSRRQMDGSALGVLRRLHQRLLQPLALPEDTERLFLVPDADLHLLPFDLLLDDDGWLIEQFTLHLLSNAADRVNHDREPRRDQRPDVVMVDPSFDGELSSRQLMASVADHAQVIASDALSLAGLRSLECGTTEEIPAMAALPGSRREGRSIRRFLRRSNQVELYAGTDATVANLLGVQNPRVLHIATHGFFLPGCTGQDSKKVNPLLLSGLALTGANDPERFGEVAFLTAYQASQLNLQETALVVLSACDTGAGVVGADGLYGLRRSFEHAGAATVVTSLWPVPDQETAELMESYYRRLSRGASTIAALQAAKMEMRETVQERYGADLPAFWAGFVAVGEDRPLPGLTAER